MVQNSGNLAGSFVPIVTPVHEDGTFDGDACDRLVDRVMSGGASGIVALGTTGEFSLVPPEMRASVVRRIRRRLDKAAPLIVSCGRPSVSETIDEVLEAEAEGASHCLVTPGYYLSLGADEIVRQFAAIRTASAMPLLYYHIPTRTAGRGGAETVRRLHRDGLILGLKDSGGPNPAFLDAMIAIRDGDPRFEILLGGSSGLLQAAPLGVRAVTSATGCIAPEIEREVLSGVEAGDLATAASAQRRLVALIQLILSANPENAAVGTKALLAISATCGPWPLPPFAPASPAWITGAKPQLGIILGTAFQMP
jgi:dihydrodipicolinate synthase/N-acetylneuraminate lyase